MNRASAGRALRSAVGLTVVVLFCLGSAATLQVEDDRDLPTLKLHTERLREDPVRGTCPGPADVIKERGRPPDASEEVARLTLTAVDGPARMEVYESVLVEWAAAHCLDGVSVLLAETDGPPSRVVRVEATTWLKGPPRDPAAPATDVAARPARDPEKDFWGDEPEGR